jgi:hypothetical protein
VLSARRQHGYPPRRNPPLLPEEATHPLTPLEFLEAVLLPEAAVTLIELDLHCDRAKAEEVLVESRPYGFVNFPNADRDGPDEDSDTESEKRDIDIHLAKVAQRAWVTDNHLSVTGSLIHLRCGVADYLDGRQQHLSHDARFPPTAVFGPALLTCLQKAVDAHAVKPGKGGKKAMHRGKASVRKRKGPGSNPTSTSYFDWLKGVRLICLTPLPVLTLAHTGSTYISQCNIAIMEWVLFAVHLPSHWCFIAARSSTRTITFYDSLHAPVEIALQASLTAPASQALQWLRDLISQKQYLRLAQNYMMDRAEHLRSPANHKKRHIELTSQPYMPDVPYDKWTLIPDPVSFSVKP